jgi:hypothetical protein
MEEKLSGTQVSDSTTQEIIAAYSDDKADVYAMPSMSLAVVFSSVSSDFSAKKKYKAPKMAANTPKENDGWELEPYDTDNLHPQRLKKIIESNIRMSKNAENSAIELLGHGIHTGIFEFNDKTQEDTFKFQRQVKWNDFAKMANLSKNYSIQAAFEIMTHYICFVSLILNEDKTAIVSLKARSPLECRLSKMEADGSHKFCFVSRQWHNNPSIFDKERVKAIPVIDSWFLDFDAIRETVQKGSALEYILVCRIPTADSPYPYPAHLAAIRQKYVELSNNVPLWKTAIMKHQTTLNQILYISEDYFRLKYPSWQVMVEKAKAGDKEAIAFIRSKRETVTKDIHNQITGLENSGKMILGHLLQNPNNFADKNLQKSFLVEAVEQVKLDGKWIPDANEADRQIDYAWSIDGTQYGGIPGSTDSGGSNKREASNNSQLMKYMFEEVLLEPLRFVRDFNQMGDFDFMVKRAMTPTLDQVTAKDRQLNQPK